MELIILNQQEADENTGEYLPNKIVDPLEISEGVFVLPRDLSEAQGLESYREAILIQPYFTIGDGSETDLIYQQYLIDSQIEV